MKVQNTSPESPVFHLTARRQVEEASQDRKIHLTGANGAQVCALRVYRARLNSDIELMKGMGGTRFPALPNGQSYVAPQVRTEQNGNASVAQRQEEKQDNDSDGKVQQYLNQSEKKLSDKAKEKAKAKLQKELAEGHSSLGKPSDPTKPTDGATAGDGSTRHLTPEEKTRLEALTDDPSSRKAIDSLMSQSQSPAQARELLAALEAAPKEVRGKLALTLGQMKPDQIGRLLKQKINGKPMMAALVKTLKTLPKDAQKALGRILSSLDPEDASTMLKFTQHLGGKALKSTLSSLDLGISGLKKTAGAGAAKKIGKVFSAMDSIVKKLGVPLSAKVAGRVLTGVTKIVPGLGAAASAYSAFDMGKVAADSSLPKEIRFLGGVGVGLNGADAALGVLEMFGVGNIGLPANLALGAATLGLELYVDHQIDQYKANPKGWKPSKNLNALVAGSAALGGPAGMMALVATFGPTEAQSKLIDLGTVAGEAGIKVVEETGVFVADAVGGGLKMTAAGIDALADLIRNPRKLAEYAKRLGQSLEQVRQGAISALGKAAKMAGELGKKAVRALKSVGSWLATQGQKGLKTLQWMVNPENWDDLARFAHTGIRELIRRGGELGKAALDGLAQMGKRGLRLAEDALRGLAGAGKKGLEMLKHAYEKFRNSPIKAFQELGESTVKLIKQMAQKAGELGHQALETLVDFVKAQPKLAKKAISALRDLASQGGAAAVRIVKRFGSQLCEGGKALVDSLRNLGEAGLGALKSIAKAGGALADYAGDVLRDLGQHFDEVVKSYDNGVHWPWDPRAKWWIGTNPFR